MSGLILNVIPAEAGIQVKTNLKQLPELFEKAQNILSPGHCPKGRGRNRVLGQALLGFKDIVDRIQIDRQLWEQQRRNRGARTQEVTEKERKMDSEAGETDAWTSRQDGTPLEPPDEMAPGVNKSK